MKEYAPVKEGKIREVYDIGDSLIMVATDRISAFDHILKNKISDKGAILTQMSKFWFDFTKDILPNHMLSVDVNDMPEFFRKPEFTGNSMKVKKLHMLPLECIVRGYITGSGWASYKENGTVCGIKLPEGLKESEKLPEPIYTPSTKAEIGLHDENISYEQSIDVLEKEFPGKGEEYASKLKDATIALYKKCADYALSKGAHILNDIWGLHYDPDMAAIAAKYKVPVIIMHNSNDTNYGDIIEDMKAYFFFAVDKALKVGVTPQQIWLDPGIGFGKTEEQNIEVMQRLGELTAYEYPILLAPSRKRFIGSMLGGLPPEDRDEGTVAACITGVFQGVDMVRVHNVKMHKRALAVADGLLRGE